MTLDQHRQRIRQLELRLHIADYGMGMPRDFATVLMLTAELANARKELAAQSDGLSLRHEAAVQR